MVAVSLMLGSGLSAFSALALIFTGFPAAHAVGIYYVSGLIVLLLVAGNRSRREKPAA